MLFLAMLLFRERSLKISSNWSKARRCLRFFKELFRESKIIFCPYSVKDAFELESHKLTRTVVFANLAPSIADTAMTLNTLRCGKEFKNSACQQRHVSKFQCCGTVTIFYGSGSDFWQATVPVPVLLRSFINSVPLPVSLRQKVAVPTVLQHC